MRMKRVRALAALVTSVLMVSAENVDLPGATAEVIDLPGARAEGGMPAHQRIVTYNTLIDRDF